MYLPIRVISFQMSGSSPATGMRGLARPPEWVGFKINGRWGPVMPSMNPRP